MKIYDLVIIGSGPAGMSAAITQKGLCWIPFCWKKNICREDR